MFNFTKISVSTAFPQVSGVSSLSLSITIGSEISSNIVMSLSKSIDLTDLSGNWLCHALLYFPVDFHDRDNSVAVFYWLLMFNIKRTFMFFLKNWMSSFSLTVDGSSIG